MPNVLLSCSQSALTSNPCHTKSKQTGETETSIMSKTMKKLNDNNVTEVIFLSGRVAVTFSFSFGPLGQGVSSLSLWPSWLQSTITGKLFGL